MNYFNIWQSKIESFRLKVQSLFATMYNRFIELKNKRENMKLLDKIFPHRIWKKRLNDLKHQQMFSRLSAVGKSRKKGFLNNINNAKLLKYIAIGSFVSLVLLVLTGISAFAWFAKDLPQPDKIVRREGFATKIFDRNGNLLYEVYADEKRIPATLEAIPLTVRQATIAIEDKDFYKHEGFDFKGYLRIVYNALFKQRIIGGSTLTQQIVKNVLLSQERTLTRKMKELVLAIQIERLYSKDEILQIYLNEAPYGGTAWGIATAAETYFGKSVKDLNLVESAILAGLPQSPSYYSPYGNNPDAFKFRTTDVLRRMREDGYITKDQEKQALADMEQITFRDPGVGINAPHFVMYVKGELEKKYGEQLVAQGGLQVTTSLDLELHQKIQSIVKEEIDQVAESAHITNGAVMVMDPQTGEVLSMVGSKDYFAQDYDGKVNVVLSQRQPGSSIKPVTYAAALSKGIFTPETMIMDVKTEFPGVDAAHPYVPKNYNGKFNGPVSLRTALASSLNIPAVKLLAMVGVDNMMQLAYDMGIESFDPTNENVNRVGLSVTLGGGELRLLDLASAYSTFANEGHKVEPISILKVVNRDAKVLEEVKPVKGKQVLSAQVAYLISHMLSDNSARSLTFGSNSLLNIAGRTVAVKTGTTDDQRDNWAIGWTPQVIVGVWVGNNDNSKMKSVASGVSGASPIWRRSILEVLNKKPAVEFPMPTNMEWTDLDKISGYPAHDGFESKSSIIIAGSQPSGADPIHTKLKVCRDDGGKLAPPDKVVRGDYDEKEFFVFKEDDPLYGNDDNHWQKGIDEWVASQSDSRYHPPTEFCSAGDDVGVVFETPGDHTSNLNNEFEVRVRVGTTGDIDKIEIYANGEKKGETKDRPYIVKIKLDDGTYELKAKVYRKDGKTGESTIRVGVKKDWDWAPQPSSTPTPSPIVSPTSTPKNSN